MFDPDSKMGGLQNLADLPTCHVTFGPCNIWSFGMTIGMAGAPKKRQTHMTRILGVEAGSKSAGSLYQKPLLGVTGWTLQFDILHPFVVFADLQAFY